jgi:hypothetical protein
VHQTFEGDGFVVCSFCPRPYDFDPQAVPVPYNHSNVMSDEVIYYASSEFMSRKGIEYGSVTLHPDGVPHGPHPGRTEQSLGQTRTDELAVMVDTFDYAGLFPPASLPLEQVVRHYAAYRRGRLAWMLGRLVLPASTLPAFSTVADAVLPTGEGAVPWRIAALIGEDSAADLARVAEFNERGAAGRAIVDVVETRIGPGDDVGALADLVPAAARLVCEVPEPFEGAMLDRLASAGAVAKLRTGGTVPGAIPAASVVAAFLWETARRRLRVKATAGLHHPVRGEFPLTYAPGAPRETMHGFVNVMMAAAWVFECASGDGRTDPAPPAEVAALLERRDVESVRFGDSEARWGEQRLSTETIGRMRRSFALAVGSCSFEDPVSELDALGWLRA